MPEAAEADSMLESERLDMAVDQAVAAHNGDLRRTIRSLLMVQWRLESKVSQGFTSGVRYGRFHCYNG